MNDYKKYICSYSFQGSQWTIIVDAKSREEAEERLKRLVYAKVDGELMAEIPALPGAGVLVRAWTWLINTIALK